MTFDPRQHLIQLKGKGYLPVAARLIWPAQEAPRYTIQTAILKLGDAYAVCQATVTTPSNENVALKTATALKRENKTHLPDLLENAEPRAVGRALGMLEFGLLDTQVAPRFDELQGNLEPRVVDSPIIASTHIVSRSQSGATPSPALESPPFVPALISSVEFNQVIPSSLAVTTAEDDHAAVDSGEIFSEPTQRHLMAIASALFDSRDPALATRCSRRDRKSSRAASFSSADFTGATAARSCVSSRRARSSAACGRRKPRSKNQATRGKPTGRCPPR